jgi:hypothetical protein
MWSANDPTPAPARPRRHALGMPAGSVRALLALGVLGLAWAIVLRYHYGTPLTEKTLPLAFVYLLFLMMLILAHFFAAHGSTIGTHISSGSPLHLPRGTVRFILLAGYLGLSAFLYYYNHKDFQFPTEVPFVVPVGLLIFGFCLGHILSKVMWVVGRGQLPDWFVDFEAWVALISFLGLAVLLLVHVMINPSVSTDLKIDIPTAEACLAAVVGFYFGART